MQNTLVGEVCATLLAHYQAHKRGMPWREPEPDGCFDAYKIMVSEIMLQQTQVSRVIPKYIAFLKCFPDVKSLANASLADVLSLWQGLGYNRRAKFLWQASGKVVESYDGIMTSSVDELITLPGIGVNTAGAICAYAFNQPVIFIETNIRTVFIYHFFKDQAEIEDKQLGPLVAEVLAQWQSMSGLGPREYYWALMDYGSHLKQSSGNAARRSKTYAKQSVFKGSKRQVRGAVLRALAGGALPIGQLTESIADERVANVCDELAAEGLITRNGDLVKLG